MRNNQIQKYCLLITGCISPHPDVPYIKLKTGDERERQYLDSLEFYIQYSIFDKIVFCDNSNAKCPDFILEFAEKKGKQFEWLSFPGSIDEAIMHGKGYGEGEIIKYAIGNSKLIEDSEYMVKITGRIKVLNVNTIARGFKTGRSYFICNSRTNIDTKMYEIPIDLYNRYFINAYLNVYDTQHIFLENIFSDVIHRNNLRYHCFNVYPNIQGVSGSTGKTYSLSLLHRCILLARSNIRRLSK